MNELKIEIFLVKGSKNPANLLKYSLSSLQSWFFIMFSTHDFLGLTFNWLYANAATIPTDSLRL